MERLRRIFALLLAATCMVSSTPISMVQATFTPQPGTAYATEFIQKCDGQQWFIDEIERQLNAEQKTLDTITSAADLSAIKSLGFANKAINGALPRALGEFSELRYFFASGNRLQGAIPAELYTLPKLQSIDLSNNLYAMPIPPAFGTMPALTHLNLRGNGFTGSIPATLLQNTQLQHLDISSNKLTGALPVALSGMTNLTYLAISDNAWGGSLPDLSALTRLKSLSAWNCKLTGSLPSGLYTLTSLQVLDLAGNSITGALPAELGNLADLQLLSLGSNALTGEIPAEIHQLTALITLDISDNALSGIVPDAFASMHALETVRMENNQLRGHIPQSLKAKHDSKTAVFAQNNYLTGAALKDMSNNAQNFTDGAQSEQYQLSAPEFVQIKKNGTTDLYAYLSNRSLTDGSAGRKLRLPSEIYTATIIGDASKLTLTRVGGAILVQAIDEIPQSASILIEIAVSGNAGSDYSKARIKLTTDTLGGGGGGGMGGGAIPPTTSTMHAPYISGYPDGTFRAGAQVSREELAKMLIAVLEEQVPEQVAYTSFYDIDKARWSASYIERAKRLHYLQGDPSGSFRPTDAMTRAELAACLVRAAENRSMKLGEEKPFMDMNGSRWYAEAVGRAAALGLITGYTDGTFRPENSVTRAEAVSMMNRLVQRDPQTAATLTTATCPFRDVNQTEWSYLQIMEAAVAHPH